MITKLTGAEMIMVERQRQKDREGYNKDHDAEHTDFALTKTAICYAASAASIEVVEEYCIHNTTVPAHRDLWPFECCYDKRSKHDQLKKLAIAGALIAAEIDRLKDI